MSYCRRAYASMDWGIGKTTTAVAPKLFPGKQITPRMGENTDDFAKSVFYPNPYYFPAPYVLFPGKHSSRIVRNTIWSSSDATSADKQPS